MTHEIEDIFGPDGLLARTMERFEPRSGQLTMAEAVHATLDGSGQDLDRVMSGVARILAVEAETGIGKTLAYLVPAALCNRKVVVSTNTINLQDQILDKEIPFIRKHIAPWLDALCVKGRENYLCLFRANQFLSAPQMHLFGDSREAGLLREWLFATDTGDRAELDWLPDNSPLWAQLCSSSRSCLGGDCPESHSCFISRLRRRAAKAHVLIVNHHLFFSDLGLRRFGYAEVLPRYEAVVFDEAHHLEGVATTYFGTSCSTYQILDLVSDLEGACRQLLDRGERDKTMQIGQALASQAKIFTELFPRRQGRFPLAEVTGAMHGWQQELDTLFAALTALHNQLGTLVRLSEMWDGLRGRVEDIRTSLEIITRDQDPAAVYWVERRPKTVSLAATPIDVAPHLQEHLYAQVESLVFTSATLTTSGNFSYFFERLGLPRETVSLNLASPFDYSTRTRLYIPAKGFPEPASPKYQELFLGQVQDLLAASGGRSLLLFTSIRAMKAAYEHLLPRLPFPVLIQGEAPKAVLLQEFQATIDSVLLAVASFWEGVNVPGEALSCVIIDKLPFEVPSDPVIMARINKVKAEGGNPFFDFQTPRAILTLRQGLGRLMRAATDQGVMAVMDVRLYTKSYGRMFLKSLPGSPIVRDIPEVERFFDEKVKD